MIHVLCDVQRLSRDVGGGTTATPAEIKKAYEALASRYHPDKSTGDKSAEERFKPINADELVACVIGVGEGATTTPSWSSCSVPWLQAAFRRRR